MPGLTILPKSGFAVLRGESQAAWVPFGPYGGDHGHFDRLSLQVWPWSLDPGTPPYSLDSRRGWYQQTAAHNAVLVDGHGQEPGAGTLLETTDDGSVTLESGEVHPGVSLRRSVSLAGDSLTDCTKLTSDTEHTYDWLLHLDAEPDLTGFDLRPDAVSLGPGGYLKVTHTAAVDAPFTVRFVHGDDAYRLTIDPGASATVLIGTGPGLAWNPPVRRHLIAVRVVGRSARIRATCEAVLDA